jgi:hypothetical protein
MFKSITPKDIEYKDDKILNIAGIEFQKGKIILERDICSLTLNTDIDTSETFVENNSKILSDNWEKYLNFLRG